MGKTKDNLSQDDRSPKQDFKLAAFNVRIIFLRIKTRPKWATLTYDSQGIHTVWPKFNFLQTYCELSSEASSQSPVAGGRIRQTFHWHLFSIKVKILQCFRFAPIRTCASKQELCLSNDFVPCSGPKLLRRGIQTRCTITFLSAPKGQMVFSHRCV